MRKLTQHERRRQQNTDKEHLKIYLGIRHCPRPEHLICLCLKVPRKKLASYLRGERSCSNCKCNYGIVDWIRCPCCNRQLRTSNRWKKNIPAYQVHIDRHSY